MKTHRVKYFLEVARAVATASPCARKQIGAILVKNGDIISTGYNGSVRGAINCGTDTPCGKNIHEEASYTSYLYCASIHAEHNAVLNAGRRLALGSTMFLSMADGNGMSGPPCHGCRRAIIQGGVYDIYYYDPEGYIVHEIIIDWIEDENQWIIQNTEPLEKTPSEWDVDDIKITDNNQSSMKQFLEEKIETSLIEE